MFHSTALCVKDIACTCRSISIQWQCSHAFFWYLLVDVNPTDRFCVDATTSPSSDLSSNTSSLTIACTVSIDRKAVGSPEPYLVFESTNGSRIKLDLIKANESVYYYYTERLNQTLDGGGVYSCILKSPLHYLHDEDHIWVKFPGMTSKVSFLWIYADVYEVIYFSINPHFLLHTGNALENIIITSTSSLASTMSTTTMLSGSGSTESLSSILESSHRLNRMPYSTWSIPTANTMSTNLESLPATASYINSTSPPSPAISPPSDGLIWLITVAMTILVFLGAILILAVCIIIIRLWLKRNRQTSFPLAKESYVGRNCNKMSDIVRVDNSGDVSISCSFNRPDNDQALIRFLPRGPHNMSKNMSKVSLMLPPT